MPRREWPPYGTGVDGAGASTAFAGTRTRTELARYRAGVPPSMGVLPMPLAAAAVGMPLGVRPGPPDRRGLGRIQGIPILSLGSSTCGCPSSSVLQEDASVVEPNVQGMATALPVAVRGASTAGCVPRRRQSQSSAAFHLLCGAVCTGSLLVLLLGLSFLGNGPA